MTEADGGGKVTQFKPMLAAKYDAAAIERLLTRGPVLASPKLDGVRAIVRDGKLVSRSLKFIPNEYCQRLFGRPELEGLDGELVVGPPFGNDVMQRTTSGVMRAEGEPDVTWYVFDYALDYMAQMPFRMRLEEVLHNQYSIRVVPVSHREIETVEQLDAYEAECLAAGFEGVMVRDPKGPYKHGRSTAKEGYLIKVKRFEDFEAVVVGVEERMHNDNEKTTDELGHAKRSSHKAGKRPAGDLGALVCQALLSDGTVVFEPETPTFSIGTGFTAAQRQELWAQRESLVGKIVKYRSFAATGVKDLPRFPVFVGFRDERDL